MLEKRYVYHCFGALVPSISEHVGRKIDHFGPMMRHVGASLVILNQLGSMRGPHRISIAHLGSYLGRGDETIAVAAATAQIVPRYGTVMGHSERGPQFVQGC